MASKGTIVVVEDERIVAFDLKNRLEALGYQVDALASSGEQAQQRVELFRPDLVLMDIHLEGEMDGIETAQRIHQRFRTPVVFLTAYAEEETLQRAQATLPFGYLVKPFKSQELHATIQMALARRAAELAVERSETRLRLALDAAELGVWEWDAATGQITTGGHSDTILGSAQEPLGDTWEAFLQRVHPAERDAVEAVLREALADRFPRNLAFRYLKGNGDVGWIETHVKGYAGVNGTPARLLGVIKDITERRRMEERLQQAGVVFETTLEGIFILDATHRIVAVNPAFTAMTGYAPEDVVGRDPEEFLHARRHGDQFYPRLETAEGGQWQGETHCRRNNGEVFPAWKNVSVVRDAAGAVTHYVAAFSDISALRRAEERLHHLAYHDPLTGLPNRMLFNDRLDQTLERAKRNKGRCALLFLDLDGFKGINDTLGHASGDLLLQTLACRIQQCMRRSDTAARLGGDEFVVIMDDIAHAEDSIWLARRLLDALAMPVELAGERIAVSASIGMSVYPEDGTDRSALLKAADTALYSAKSQGRNRCCFYTRELASRAAERMSIEQGLKRALEHNQFRLRYQPQVSLDGNAIIGVEALVRWQHPQEGLILPGRFIAVAEESGLIEPLGQWVLRAACAEMAAWNRATGRPIRLAVNVSARQFARDGFYDIVRDVLAETDFPAALLELEITETALQIVEHNRKPLAELKDLGVSIAIDDFGTGYSSLSVLKHLPIDRMKIDRSFIRDIPDDANDVAIVEAILSLGRTLGLSVTAEGVETEAQLEVLRGFGCSEIQGYLFSPPRPLNELQGFLAELRPRADPCNNMPEPGISVLH